MQLIDAENRNSIPVAKPLMVASCVCPVCTYADAMPTLGDVRPLDPIPEGDQGSRSVLAQLPDTAGAHQPKGLRRSGVKGGKENAGEQPRYGGKGLSESVAGIEVARRPHEVLMRGPPVSLSDAQMADGVQGGREQQQKTCQQPTADIMLSLHEGYGDGLLQLDGQAWEEEMDGADEEEERDGANMEEEKDGESGEEGKGGESGEEEQEMQNRDGEQEVLEGEGEHDNDGRHGNEEEEQGLLQDAEKETCKWDWVLGLSVAAQLQGCLGVVQVTMYLQEESGSKYPWQ